MGWECLYPFITASFCYLALLIWQIESISNSVLYAVLSNFFLLYNLFHQFGRRCAATKYFRFPSLHVIESNLNFSQEEKRETQPICLVVASGSCQCGPRRLRWRCPQRPKHQQLLSPCH